MKRYLLDSDTMSALARDPGGAAARRAEGKQDACITSIIVAAELRFGLRKNPSTRLAAQVEPVLDAIPALPFESPADDHYARIRANLEARGTLIGANDLLIAAQALALDATLVTGNEREFRRVPGLRVENWIA